MDPASRGALHRLAAHVLGRRRYEVSGRFGLRAGPGGIATPAFGDGPEVVRVAGGVLIREQSGTASYRPMEGASLAELAAFTGADLTIAFSSGADTPELGDVAEPIRLAGAYVDAVADWFALGWRALDVVLGGLPPDAEPATLQLWPEHFDVGTHVGVAPGQRVNLGASPGDAYSEVPYLYVGPWSAERPGEAGFWNAPFGAALSATEVGGSSDPVRAAVQFFRRGLDLVAAGNEGVS